MNRSIAEKNIRVVTVKCLIPKIKWTTANTWANN